MAETKKPEVKNWNHITIQGWMRNEMGLYSNELIIYALIYGFSQSRNQWCSASQDYIAEWAGITPRGVRKILESFIERGLISKRYYADSRGKGCEYKALIEFTDSNEISFSGNRNLVPEGQEFSSGGIGTQFPQYRNTVPVVQELSSDNNIDNNIDNIIDNNVIGASAKKRTPKKPFIKPSLEEVQAYCTEKHYSVNPQRFIDYYDSNGWKVGKNPMKDWKAAVRTWQHNGYSNGGYSTGNSTTCGNNNPADYNDIFE
ncbi:MAG: helix-turn-helix domain-containing protein [archaeon]|nr:helix-turn-helix domain-containing protein [archaeon]